MNASRLAARAALVTIALAIAGATGHASLIVPTDLPTLVGEAQTPRRFLYATGFSGHGFLQGPAVGEIVRDLVLGREPFVDVAALSAERFARAETRPERNVI